MLQEFNLRIRIEVRGEDALEATEQDVKDFIFFETVGGSISNDNPFMNEDLDCEIHYIELD